MKQVLKTFDTAFVPRGRIFSRVRPFYEWAVSDLDRSMHRSLWFYVTHSTYIHRSHTTKNMASVQKISARQFWIQLKMPFDVFVNNFIGILVAVQADSETSSFKTQFEPLLSLPVCCDLILSYSPWPVQPLLSLSQHVMIWFWVNANT
jgi:hypothetical protein